MHHTVYLGLGSNLGDRQANLGAAISALPPAVLLLAQSPIYQTAPWGYTDQADFLNQVVQAETELSPQELLAHLKGVEAQVGRTPTFRYGPREIDLDILFYDDLSIELPGLTIPHPRLAQRAFVLVPLADLAPDFKHPALDHTISELLASVGRQGVIRYEG